MKIYYKKRWWKWLLFAAGVAIITISLWYTNRLVREIAKDERTNVRIWANAIRQKAELVNYTNKFFDQIREEERKRAEMLAMAYSNLRYTDDSPSLEFYRLLMEKNTTIPIILTNRYDSITNYKNIDEAAMQEISVMNDTLKEEFSTFDPIRIVYHANEYVLLYYKESKIYTELRDVLNNLTESFFAEVVGNSASVPVIITDSTMQNIIEYGNIDKENLGDSTYVADLIAEMAGENDPIEIQLPERGTNYIFYNDSSLLTQIFYYPYIQFTVIGVFLLISYILFSSARKAEQNLVWIGMSKETAHQLGTPLSSIMAWLELLKMKGIKDEGIEEMEKDVQRLENISDRFSKIGSPSKLEKESITDILHESVEYLRPRTSKKINYRVISPENEEIIAPVNKHLFEWVIENVCKNAVDAMGGKGDLTIRITPEPKNIIVDIEDTGKGIPKSHFKSIFNPGYTSKKRGWGLGLSLSKRIIENYHRGKIFVKSSVLGQGTTVRIILKRKTQKGKSSL
jgi:hypothetical protein